MKNASVKFGTTEDAIEFFNNSVNRSRGGKDKVRKFRIGAESESPKKTMIRRLKKDKRDLHI